LQKLKAPKNKQALKEITMPKKKEVAISSEPVYKKPTIKSPKKAKKKINPKA
jgi:hypothetical protein